MVNQISPVSVVETVILPNKAAFVASIVGTNVASWQECAAKVRSLLVSKLMFIANT